MGWQGGSDSVFGLDAKTGQELWRQSYKCPEYGRFHTGDEGAYHGVLPTPSYDAATGYLYSLSVDGDLCCWDTRSGGKRVWRMNLYDTYKVPQRPNTGGELRDYGYTSAPLVLGDWLIVEVGATEGNLMAFNKRTGARQWVSQCKDPAGHTGGPAPITVNGISCVAVLTIRELVIVRTDRGHEGETACAYDWLQQFAANVPSPTVEGDEVLLTSGLNISRTVCIRMALGGATEVWESRAFSRACSPVVSRGCVYLAYGPLKCLDLATGETKWTGSSFGDDGSCLATGDGKLIVYGNRKLALVDIADSAAVYRELALKPGVGSGRCWPHPVLADGRLCVKDDMGKLYCFAVGP
jgi:outer membrane protein assembly factor BamB